MKRALRNMNLYEKKTIERIPRENIHRTRIKSKESVVLQKVENSKMSRNVKYSFKQFNRGKILLRSIINNKKLAKDVRRKELETQNVFKLFEE